MDAMISRVLLAIDHIEDQLHQALALEDIAKAAGLSQYHLHRWFTAIFGYSIKAYVRRRRLTEAAVQLRTTDRDVLEIALESCFQSQASFTRAFRNLFGVPPGRYRKMGAHHWYGGLPRASAADLAHWRDGVTHEPKLRTLDAVIPVIGVQVPFDLEAETTIFEAWGRLLDKFGSSAHLAEGYGVVYATGATPLAVDVSTDLHYLAATPLIHHRDSQANDPEFVTLDIQPGLYAVFRHEGPLYQIMATVDYIWASWLPRSGFTKSDRPDFERFVLSEFDLNAQANSTLEMWMSVDQSN